MKREDKIATALLAIGVALVPSVLWWKFSYKTVHQEAEITMSEIQSPATALVNEPVPSSTPKPVIATSTPASAPIPSPVEPPKPKEPDYADFCKEFAEEFGKRAKKDVRDFSANLNDRYFFLDLDLTRDKTPAPGGVTAQIRALFANRQVSWIGGIVMADNEDFGLGCVNPGTLEAGDYTVRFLFPVAVKHINAKLTGGDALRKGQRVKVTGKLKADGVDIWWKQSAGKGEVVPAIVMDATEIVIVQQSDAVRLDLTADQTVSVSKFSDLLDDVGFITSVPGQNVSFPGHTIFNRAISHQKQGVKADYIVENNENIHLCMKHGTSEEAVFMEILERTSGALKAEGAAALKAYRSDHKTVRKQIGKIAVAVNEKGVVIETVPAPSRFASETHP